MKKSFRGIILFFLILNLFFFCSSSQITGEMPSRGPAADLSEVFGYDGFGVIVTVDQPAYCTEFMPPNMQLGEAAVPVIEMAITVFNNSPEPVTFTENCFKYEIYDSREVLVWEKNTCRPEEVTLNPGESRSHTFVHTFEELSGDPMPEDLYMLKGALEVIFPESYSHQSRFHFREPGEALNGSVSFWHTYSSAPASGNMNDDLQQVFELDDFGVVVSIDQPAYYTHYMPPDINLGDKEYPVIHMAVTIFNNSDMPVRFTQECFHFKIFNSDDALVWEKNTCRPSQILLNPGDALSFAHARIFKDEDTFPAGPMPEDLYTLEGTIEVSFPESYSRRPVFQGFIGTFRGNVSFFHSYAD